MARWLRTLSVLAIITGAGCEDDSDPGEDAGNGSNAGSGKAGSGASGSGASGSGASGSGASGSGAKDAAPPNDPEDAAAPDEPDAAEPASDAAIDGGPSSSATFFVSSQTNPTGDLGGLEGADERCQTLAEAVGLGDKTWHAYLSAENDGDPIHARDRIGEGPFINVKGDMLAEDLDALHARNGDVELFLDENGEKVPGQWTDSPTPIEHDILTGSTPEGEVMPGMTCEDWTSDSSDLAAQVGHSDGRGPGQNPDPPYNSWQSSHANESCANTSPRGGAGRIYCFGLEE